MANSPPALLHPDKTAYRLHLDTPMGGAYAPDDLSSRDPAMHPHAIVGSRARHRPACLLEVNYGGDLNLAQLAHGTGVLDERYVEHLARCGYRSRALREAMGVPSRKSRPLIPTSPSSVT